jgi:hypothetical protein
MEMARLLEFLGIEKDESIISLASEKHVSAHQGSKCKGRRLTTGDAKPWKLYIVDADDHDAALTEAEVPWH